MDYKIKYNSEITSKNVSDYFSIIPSCIYSGCEVVSNVNYYFIKEGIVFIEGHKIEIIEPVVIKKDEVNNKYLYFNYSDDKGLYIVSSDIYDSSYGISICYIYDGIVDISCRDEYCKENQVIITVKQFDGIKYISVSPFFYYFNGFYRKFNGKYIELRYNVNKEYFLCLNFFGDLYITDVIDDYNKLIIIAKVIFNEDGNLFLEKWYIDYVKEIYYISDIIVDTDISIVNVNLDIVNSNTLNLTMLNSNIVNSTNFVAQNVNNTNIVNNINYQMYFFNFNLKNAVLENYFVFPLEHPFGNFYSNNIDFLSSDNVVDYVNYYNVVYNNENRFKYVNSYGIKMYQFSNNSFFSFFIYYDIWIIFIYNSSIYFFNIETEIVDYVIDSNVRWVCQGEDGYIFYIKNNDSNIYLLDLKTRNSSIFYTFTKNLFSIYYKNNKLFFGTTDGMVYYLDINNNFNVILITNQNIISYHFALYNDNILYFNGASNQTVLYKYVISTNTFSIDKTGYNAVHHLYLYNDILYLSDRTAYRLYRYNLNTGYSDFLQYGSEFYVDYIYCYGNYLYLTLGSLNKISIIDINSFTHLGYYDNFVNCGHFVFDGNSLWTGSTSIYSGRDKLYRIHISQ